MTTCPIGPTCLGCAKCDPEYHAKRARQLRTAIDPTPPDSYEPQLARLRAELPTNAWPEPRPTEMHLDANGIPDPYFHVIQARLREENKR